MGDAAKTRMLLAGLALLFLAAALAAPVNHDESQYVAAIALMREGLPYRDWPYLQTPLQPLLLSPMSLLPAGWLLVAARLANVGFALVTCWALLRLLRGRVPFGSAALAVGAMAVTNAFLFAAQVARNDALPVALLSLGLLALAAERLVSRRALLAALCFGLAISAKISLALPVAGAGLWLLWQRRELVPVAIVGGLAGLLPCLILLALAPTQFMFGVFTYSLEAPQQYWTAVGMAERLALDAKLLDFGSELLKGASGVALLVAMLDWRRRSPLADMLSFTLVGGLVAAILPDPFFEQYAVPLLPALFARAALALPDIEGRARIAVSIAGAVTSAVGLGDVARDTARGWRDGQTLVTAVRHGRIVAAAANGRPVASLAPERLAGADVRLAPGFAAGPFLFRTSDGLAGVAHGVTGAPTWQQMSALDRASPAIIVTGGERRARPPLFPQGVDAPLDDWARARGDRAMALPGKDWTMWIRD